ncbi:MULTISPECIES: serine hydrolase domain-containing protein [Protofrankia]|uniref:serine hydrolase domain-containing protein n=1 Tax=Protofrankia TaxID=2994361 RepID=UPI0001C52F18|nr:MULTISPECIES: serine hydrolase domain-containing protein [Protofrankia]
MDALAQVDAWPVENAAVAVLLSGGSADPGGPAGSSTAAGTGDALGAVTVAGSVGDADRLFRLASVSKLLSAYAVLIAVEEGVFALDDPAGPPGSTVAHMLAHTSGLEFAGSRLLAEPGARRVYSNTGFEILGETLEKASGIAFPDYLAESVFAPLGMGSSELRGSPAHAVWSNLHDMIRFAAELLAPRLLAPATFALATSVAFPGLIGVLPGFGAQKPNDWGLGFEIRGGKQPHWTGSTNSPATFGHFGRSGTFLWVDPAPRAACVALTDREFGTWAAQAWPVLSDDVVAAVRAAGVPR